MRGLLLAAAVPLMGGWQSDEAGLKPVFAFRFAEDPRPELKVRGDVTWSPGHLDLAAAASVAKTVSSPRVLVRFSRQAAGDGSAEFLVRFRIAEATDCLVRLRERVADGKTVWSVALLDTPQDQSQDPVVVREADVEAEGAGDVSVEYRHGLVRVGLGGQVLFSAYVENGSRAVETIAVQAGDSVLRMTSLGVSAESVQTAEISDEDRRRLDEATAADGRLGQFYAQGKFAEALAEGETSLKIRREVLGEKHTSYGTSLANMAAMYHLTGDSVRAASLFRASMDIHRATVGVHHPSYAIAMQNLALALNARGDYAGAAENCRKAGVIFRAIYGRESIEHASSLHNLGATYEQMGEYARAEPLVREAMEIRRTLVGEQHQLFSLSLNSLATLRQRMGDLAGAAPLFERSIELAKAAQGAEHPGVAISISNLATLYQAMQDYEKAEPLFKQAVAIQRVALGEQHPKYTEALSNLATHYFMVNDYERAQQLLEQARGIEAAVLGEQHPDYARTIHNLATVYERAGHFEKAEPLLEQAVAIRRATLGEHHPMYAMSVNNLASLHYFAGNYSRAEELATVSVQRIRDHLNSTSLIQSQRQQKSHQARQWRYLDNRVAIAVAGGTGPVETLEAIWQWKGAVTLRQRTYRRAAANPKLAPLFQSLQAVSRQLSAVAAAVPMPPGAGADVAAREEYEQRREQWKHAFATLTGRREEFEQQIAADSAEFRELREPLTVTALQDRLQPGTAFVDFLEYDHGSADPEREGERISERRYVAFVVRPDRDPVMLSLGSVEQLREAITRFRRPFSGDVIPVGESQQAAAQLRKELWVPLEPHLKGVETVVVSPDTALGTLPFAALPGPAAGSFLLEQYRFVSMPLAGMLRSLVDSRTDRNDKGGLLVLGDIDYGEAKSADAASGDGPTLAMRAAPRSGAGVWRSLPGFQQELTIVRRQFERAFDARVTTLRGKQASEAEFIKQAARHPNLHIITHGFFADPEYAVLKPAASENRSAQARLAASTTVSQYMPGLLSGVVLAGANASQSTEGSSDGVLTAAEIETLDLNGVDLVVLSACETGLGQTAGGEGLTGLQRGFHIAGVRSCVATLWEVEDRATQEIMRRFYRNYWERKQSKVDALRNAQLEVLRNPTILPASTMTRGAPIRRDRAAVDASAPRQYTPPAYWAAFVLSGDWE